MADMNTLKSKYSLVIDTVTKLGGSVQATDMHGDKLYLKASVPSELAKNRVWDAIKQVDATYGDLEHDISSSGGQQTYTIQAGDNLSKISKLFYGNANQYMKIAQANNIADPNVIRAGATLVIPQ